MTTAETMPTRHSSKGIRYPAQKQDLLLRAQNAGVSEDVLSFISSMPDQEYRTPAEFRRAVLATLKTDFSGID